MGFYKNRLIAEMEQPDQYHPFGCNCALCQYRRNSRLFDKNGRRKHGPNDLTWYSVMYWQWEWEPEQPCATCRTTQFGLRFFQPRDRLTQYCQACYDKRKDA